MEKHVTIAAVLEILDWHLLPNYAFTGQPDILQRFSFLLQRMSNIIEYQIFKYQNHSTFPFLCIDVMHFLSLMLFSFIKYH